jgi:hypothetical protein
MSTTTRINRLVRAAIPKGKPVRIIWYPTGFGKSRILRVVTPAWKTLPRSDRIFKLQQAIEPSLTPKERAQIFRISVLTAQEFKRLSLMLAPALMSSPRRLNSNGFQKVVMV